MRRREEGWCCSGEKAARGGLQGRCSRGRLITSFSAGASFRQKQMGLFGEARVRWWWWGVRTEKKEITSQGRGGCGTW